MITMMNGVAILYIILNLLVILNSYKSTNYIVKWIKAKLYNKNTVLSQPACADSNH